MVVLQSIFLRRLGGQRRVVRLCDNLGVAWGLRKFDCILKCVHVYQILGYG